MHDIPWKKWERERGDLQPRLHLFHREQKAQDKLDNLAAKPFFLGIISSSSLLSHPSRARNVAQPSSHFLQTIPTSWLFPGFHRFPPFPLSFLFVVLLSRSHLHPALRLVVWHPPSLEWQTARSEGLTFAERMKHRNVYLFIRTLMRAKLLP